MVGLLQARGEPSWWLGVAHVWRGGAAIAIGRLDVAALTSGVTLAGRGGAHEG